MRGSLTQLCQMNKLRSCIYQQIIQKRSERVRRDGVRGREALWTSPTPGSCLYFQFRNFFIDLWKGGDFVLKLPFMERLYICPIFSTCLVFFLAESWIFPYASWRRATQLLFYSLPQENPQSQCLLNRFCFQNHWNLDILLISSEHNTFAYIPRNCHSSSNIFVAGATEARWFFTGPAPGGRGKSSTRQKGSFSRLSHLFLMYTLISFTHTPIRFF